MWSMMNLLETSLRVPLIIRPVGYAKRNTVAVYRHSVELLDVFPTVVDLAGLPAPPATMGLEGTNLAPGMEAGHVVKPMDAAFGQITRCTNCTLAYSTDPATYQQGCKADAVDAAAFTVPCALTPSTTFEYMGLSVRTSDWRYSLWCKWDGATLAVDWESCGKPELYNHTADTALYDVEHNGEADNIAGDPSLASTEAELKALLAKVF
eukprot:gene18329-30585_t